MLRLGTRGRGGLLTFRPLFLRSKHPRYSLNCRLRVLHNDYGQFGEKKILLTLPKINTMFSVFKPVFSPVAMPTQLLT